MRSSKLKHFLRRENVVLFATFKFRNDVFLKKNTYVRNLCVTQFENSVTISRAFARKGKLKIFVRAQKKQTRAMRELRFFSRFLASLIYLK